MHSLRPTIIKAFAVSLFCLLFLATPSLSAVMAFTLFWIASLAFLFGLVLSFDDAVPTRARIAIAYLGFVAYVHLFLGILTIHVSVTAVSFEYVTVEPSWKLIQPIWEFALRHFSRGPDPYADLSYEKTYTLIAAIVVAVSVLALGAVVAMAMRKRIGYGIWLALIVASLVASLWMVLSKTMTDPGGTYKYVPGPLTPPVWWLFCLPLTYALAFWLAGSDFNLE
jgi:hypothetical protein